MLLQEGRFFSMLGSTSRPAPVGTACTQNKSPTNLLSVLVSSEALNHAVQQGDSSPKCLSKHMIHAEMELTGTLSGRHENAGRCPLQGVRNKFEQTVEIGRSLMASNHKNNETCASLFADAEPLRSEMPDSSIQILNASTLTVDQAPARTDVPPPQPIYETLPSTPPNTTTTLPFLESTKATKQAYASITQTTLNRSLMHHSSSLSTGTHADFSMRVSNSSGHEDSRPICSNTCTIDTKSNDSQNLGNLSNIVPPLTSEYQRPLSSGSHGEISPNDGAWISRKRGYSEEIEKEAFDRGMPVRNSLPFGLRNKKMKPTDCLLYAATLLSHADCTTRNQSPTKQIAEMEHGSEESCECANIPRDVDVLCGRGGLINKHPGNIVYRKVVDYNKPFYHSVHKKHRILVSQSIVQSILNFGGRFLIMGSKGKSWIEIGYKKAVQKTSQALRERSITQEEGDDDDDDVSDHDNEEKSQSHDERASSISFLAQRGVTLDTKIRGT